VYLNGSKDLIRARMRDREHFMPPTLLDSQFALLKPPERALELDIRRTPDELVARVVSALELA
jgi:gluconokinase